MNAVVMPMYQPDIATMMQHVEHLFGGFLDGCHEGKIELAWTDTQPDAAGKYRLRHARLFGTDELDELVTEASRLNAVPMCNVYIGAALRRPETAPFARCEDEDAYALTALYVDLDDEGAAAKAKAIYASGKPTLVVQTGKEPHLRGQCWWRLDEPLTDPLEWSAALRGMAVAMGADTTVCNPGRVMRLAGSVAWPVKPGRVVEVTCIRPLNVPGQSVYAAAHLSSLFPPVTEKTPGEVDTSKAIVHTTNGLGLVDKVADGRELYMHRTVAACLLQYIGENGASPSAQELFDLAWPQYERKVDLSRPGRGADEMSEKCAYAVKRFESGQIKGLRTLDEAIDTFRRKKEAQALAPRPQEVPKPPAPPETDEPILVSALTGEPRPREWFVKDWIPAGSVTALYGDGGTGKTLLAQQLLYCAGVACAWAGIDIPLTRGLGVFCEDDEDELHRRHNDIKRSMGHAIGNPFSTTWIWPRVGFDNLLVTFDKNNQPALSAFFKRIMDHVLEKRVGFLVLDTVADLFGGNEIIRAQVNYFIKSVCGAFIKDAKAAGFTLTILLLAHPSQAGRNNGSGESGSTAWNNAVRSRLYLTRSEDGGTNDRILTRKKSNYSAAGDEETIELQWSEGALVPRIGQGQNAAALPPKDVCRSIHLGLKEAWDDGRPWSLAPRSKSEGRYAPRVISQRFPVRPQVAERLIEAWLSNGICVVEMVDKNTKMTGLKVRRGLD